MMSLPALVALAAIIYLAGLTIHRLYFSSIANIPGPKLAALTYYYQSYYDVWPQKGRFLWQCERLHQQYGPIVRIGPDEVHINDPDFYGEMYPQATRRRNKSPLWFWMGGSGNFGDNATWTTLDHDLHRTRRSAVNPYFSKRMVQDLEPRVKQHVLQLRKRLLALAGTGEVINLCDATSALTLDVITDYTFGAAMEALERPDMAKPWNDLLHVGASFHPFARTFRTFARNLMSIPSWLLPLAGETANENKKFMDIIGGMTRAAYNEATTMQTSNAEQSAVKQRTVLHSIFQSETLSETEKSYDRVGADAFIFVGAGTETTGRTLAVAFYHILSDRSVYDRLLKELRTVMPTAGSDIPATTILEKLPYLTAVVQEATRTGHGTAGRLARTAPDEDLQYGRYRIPRGTTFSQSNYLVHTHPRYYPDPFAFRPERFMGPEGEEARKHLAVFGKGPRACVGLNLAYSELFLTIATLIGSVKMELFETTSRDAETVQEYFIGCLPEDSKGIRVKVLGKA